ncbi:hypothetical protein M758_9G124600 [Ceratodon purpureus]|nr:hypothetical protein M758_9G124600 [Ceratodon purpureus]
MQRRCVFTSACTVLASACSDVQVASACNQPKIRPLSVNGYHCNRQSTALATLSHIYTNSMTTTTVFHI